MSSCDFLCRRFIFKEKVMSGKGIVSKTTTAELYIESPTAGIVVCWGIVTYSYVLSSHHSAREPQSQLFGATF